MQKTIFVVDDNDVNLAIAKEVLKEQYRVLTIHSAIKMFALLEKVTPDLILLDIEMPEMNGFEALKRLKASAQAEIPVMFLTGTADASVEANGFEMGVIDFIIKPFSPPVLLNRIKTHLHIEDLIHERTEQLKKTTIQLQHLQNAIIFSFADMVENRDKGTGGHVERTTKYIEILLNAMLESGVYIDEICDFNFESFISSARLHDVGKIAISDMVLNKPDKLNDNEFEIMKTHIMEGERIIDQMASRTDNVEFLQNAKLFAGYHHERWDGNGYPNGLKGMNIPLQGRIMAIADVYDALVSERPYKKPFTTAEAARIITESSGKQFDPALINVFDQVKDKFDAVKQMYLQE